MIFDTFFNKIFKTNGHNKYEKITQENEKDKPSIRRFNKQNQ